MARSSFPRKQDWPHILLCLFLTPLLYCYEIFFVLPTLYTEWSVTYCIHIINSVFLLHNIVGNLARGARGGGTVLGRLLPSPEEDWRPCQVCECVAPPRSWHCSVCDVCILKRDHHCNFFGCCIGYFNHRYFCMFVFYVFISTLYAFYFNLTFMIYHVRWDLKSWMAMTKFLFPLAGIAFDTSMDSVNILLFVANIIIIGFTGFLFFYHGRIILRGQITPESKMRQKFSYDDGWKNNLIDVLGEKWHLVWISPFLPSELPGEGIFWKSKSLIKEE